MNLNLKIEEIPHIKKAISMNDYIKVIANFWEPEGGWFFRI